jgi:diaminopimelate epimerase
MDLTFTKMHGLGNDFVVIDDLDDQIEFEPEAVAWLCDRHFGIGGDGLILVRPATAEGAEVFMLYYNADGTTAEMCGNGVRCLAKYAVEHGMTEGETLNVQTLGGIRAVEVAVDTEGRMEAATVDMGEPRLAAESIPTTLGATEAEAVVSAELRTLHGTFQVTCVNMGNPHAVIWVDDVDEAPVATVGPAIETNPAFPDKTNVEFAQVTDDGAIRLRVWERGVGETLACGTGACAALVAASLAGLVDRDAVIDLPGGELVVRWAEDGHVYMTGPAEEVFTGVIALDDEE